jgi:hypothetical protein
MIAIVASAWDSAARAIADEWKEYEVRLLTPLDLSRRGWSYRPGSADPGTAVLGGDLIPADEICGC